MADTPLWLYPVAIAYQLLVYPPLAYLAWSGKGESPASSSRCRPKVPLVHFCNSTKNGACLPPPNQHASVFKSKNPWPKVCDNKPSLIFLTDFDAKWLECGWGQYGPSDYRFESAYIYALFGCVRSMCDVNFS